MRGVEGIKEAKYVLPVNGKDTEIKVAVASSLKNAKTLMDLVKAGKADYHFIEIMTCPGGCVNGGGQPVQDATVRSTTAADSPLRTLIREIPPTFAQNAQRLYMTPIRV